MKEKLEVGKIAKIKKTIEQVEKVVEDKFNIRQISIVLNTTKFKEDDISYKILCKLRIEESTSQVNSNIIQEIQKLIDSAKEEDIDYRVVITNDEYETYNRLIETDNYSKEKEGIMVFSTHYTNSLIRENGETVRFFPNFYTDINSKEFNEENKKLYFELVDRLYDEFDNKINKALCYVQSLNLEFYALMWSSISKAPKMENILQQHYVEKIIAGLYENKVTNKEEIKKELNSAFTHEYWGRYQYEIEVAARGEQDKFETVDVYKQLSPNLDLIVDYVYSKLYKSFHIKRKENDETICKYVNGDI